MRISALIPLLVLAACSEGGEAEQKQAKAPAAAGLDAGQWETTAEVQTLTAMDKGSPRMNTPKGTKATASLCVAAADAKRPPSEFFTATKDACEYRNIYMSRGRLNAELTCRRPGLDGDILMTVNGSFTATTLEASSDLATRLATDGDVRIESKVTARRTGACAG